MNKETYALLFREAVETACQSAEKALGRTLGRDIVVRMFGAGTDGIDISPEDFINRTYTNDDSFYRLIDLMVIEVVDSKPVLFARVSGHTPDRLSKCWNGEKGPFKQLKAETIVQR